MTITKVQSPTPATTTGTPLSVAWPSGTTLNDLAIFLALETRSSAVTSSTTPSGYTPAGLAANDFTNSTQHIGIYPFYKVLPASDANPSSTVPSDNGNVGILGEWSGLVTASPLDAVGVVQQTNANSGSQTPSVVTTAAGDLILTIVVGHTGGSAPTITFGGGSVVEVASAVYNSNIFYATATQIAGGAGTISPTVSVSGISGTGLPIICSVSIAFLNAAPPSGTIRQVNVAGGASTVTTKLNVAGTPTIVTRKVNVAGVAV